MKKKKINRQPPNKKNVLSSIFKTLAYFDLADYPLTKEELFAYLWQPPRVGYEEFLLSLRARPRRARQSLLVTVISASQFVIPAPQSVIPAQAGIQGDQTVIPAKAGILSTDKDSSFRWNDSVESGNDKFEEKFGYYFLRGREAIVENRRRRLLISEIKMKIARRAVKKLRAIPFLRAVSVCNSVGAGQAADDSDIDFFIVSAPERIWIVRFFCNLILRLWGLRTYGKKIKNRICLSFFVDEHHLGLSNLRVAEDDIHFAYWLHQMVPIYDPDNLYEKFLRANNWTDKFLPNVIPAQAGIHGGQTVIPAKAGIQGDQTVIPAKAGILSTDKDSSFRWNDNNVAVDSRLRGNDSFRLGAIWKKIWQTMWRGAYGDLIENQAKQFQMQKMKLNIKEKAQKGDKGVVISDGVIKLHENDRRMAVKAKWDKACANIVIARE